MNDVTLREKANAIRALAMDAVEHANSGHPGMPMGMADVATVLWTKFLKFDPAAPAWPDRDRFVLSAGHGSMLLYALLHLTGFPGMTIKEIKRFRQLGSLTPGHPEHGHTPGVETTTGPLGQGIATAVGMAFAEASLRGELGPEAVDHFTYVIAGDGCLMEGISHEAVSLAGHLGLGRLIVLFDDNGISIDGPTSLAVSDDQPARFAASGWHVQEVDGHDPAAVEHAIAAARAATDRPSLIACRTIIGFGAPSKQGKETTHGAPLGAAEIAAARERLRWPHAPFEVPGPILAAWREAGARGHAERAAWEERIAVLPAARRAELTRRLAGTLPEALAPAVQALKQRLVETKPEIASRKASEAALEVLTEAVPELLGGSADLTHSNNTVTKHTPPIRPKALAGRYLHYGVREHGMAAFMNGVALHGGFIPYGGTFLAFADYCRPAIRLAALMGLPVIHVMTHDSIGLGEDGPTHQPVEHLASLRAIPNLVVLRPADAVETAEAWEVALQRRDGPSLLVLSRQNLAPVRTVPEAENLVARGAYLVQGGEGPRDVTLIGTGSELRLALDAARLLAAEGIRAAVVSMPSMELFERQDEAYHGQVLGTAPVIAVEAAVAWGWTRYLASERDFVGMASFGASAPAKDLYPHFGITAAAVAERARARIARMRAA
ncbi:MAG: transketolase [Geminicoccaceae bacterium]